MVRHAAMVMKKLHGKILQTYIKPKKFFIVVKIYIIKFTVFIIFNCRVCCIKYIHIVMQPLLFIFIVI